MDRISFKQFVKESKTQLLSAITNVPTVVRSYDLTKYCSLVLEDDNGDPETISLKPKNSILIEWKYPTPQTPELHSISIINHEEIDSDDKYNTQWTTEKFNKWLSRHTK